MRALSLTWWCFLSRFDLVYPVVPYDHFEFTLLDLEVHHLVSKLWLLSLAEAINAKHIPLTQTHPTYNEPDLVNSYMATPS